MTFETWRSKTRFFTSDIHGLHPQENQSFIIELEAIIRSHGHDSTFHTWFLLHCPLLLLKSRLIFEVKYYRIDHSLHSMTSHAMRAVTFSQH